MESGIYMLTCKINGHRYIGAALSVGVNASEITRVLKGYRNRKTSGGYHWEYHNSVETNRDECSDVGKKKELLPEVHGNLKG